MKKHLLITLLLSLTTICLSAQTAEELNEKLRQYSSAYGIESPEYADCVMWCAMKCAEANDNVQAQRLMENSCKLFKKYGNGTFDGRDTINQILMLDIKSKLENNSLRDYMALQYSKQSCKLKKSYFGKTSEQYLQSVLDVSQLYAERLNYNKSFKYHHEAYVSYVDKIKTEFCSMSESERTMYWSTASRYIDRTIELNDKAANSASGRNNMSTAAYDALLLSKGLLLNATIDFENYVKASGNALAIKHLIEKKTFSAQGEPQEILDSMDYLILADLNAQGQTYNISHLSINWRDVREKLGDDDLAIEFYQTRNGDYGAILLKNSWKTPRTVNLRSYQSHNARYNSMEEALKKNKLGADTLTKELTDDLWELGKAIWVDDIVKYFPTTHNGKVYFAAAGRLQLVGIEYLPFIHPEANAYYSVADLYNIYRLSSTRQLVGTNTIEGCEAVIYGGLNYGMSSDLMDQDAANRRRSTTRSNREAVNMDFVQLPGTKLEAEAITDIINRPNTSCLKATLIMGNDGTEASFKELSGQNKYIIHVGTHGFYESDASSDNTLETSGLCFAGANNGFYVSDGTDDGILTAKEASDMDLRGLSLLTLSACETGLGSLSSDGVFGLQRGFKMAGANSILMSLWKVNDDATKVLMTEFYGNLIKGMTKHQALKAARAIVRANEQWKNPQYWAAFILLDGLD